MRTTNRLDTRAKEKRTTVLAQRFAPTMRELSLVRDSFDQLVPVSGVAADLFYLRLFELAPSLRQMFPSDMRDQKRTLMVMIASAVQGLHDLDRLLPEVMALGARHAQYGVKDSHYQAAGEALIWTLERCLGNAFTPEIERAWTRVYLLLAATMQAGADDVATMRAAE
jgi:hemoglobin-like flavoprotein